MDYTREQLLAEKARRSAPATSSSTMGGFSREALMAEKAKRETARQIPTSGAERVDRAAEQFKEDALDPMLGYLNTAGTAFNTGVEDLAHGVLQPILESDTMDKYLPRVADASRSVAKKRHLDYEQESAKNPITAATMRTAGNIGGGIGLGAPLVAGGEAALPLVASRLGMTLPALNPWVAGALSSGASGAGFGAAQYVNPGESRLDNTTKGGALGAAFGPAGRIIGKVAKPVVDWGKRLLGSNPAIVNSFQKQMLPQEMKQAQTAHNAAKRIGTQLTPAEASGSPILAKAEGHLGATLESEKSLLNFKKGQKEAQGKAIDKFKESITGRPGIAHEDVRATAKSIIEKQTRALQDKARPHYESSEAMTIKPNRFNGLMKDSNIEKAYKDVMGSSVYQQELKGHAPNSIKALDQVKKNLDDKIDSAFRNGNKNEARILKKSKDKLLNALDQISPQYKKARGIYSEGAGPLEAIKNSEIGKIANIKDTSVKDIPKIIFDPSQTDIKVLGKIRDSINKENPDAWQKIVRNEIDRRLDTANVSKTGSHGSNFYDKIVAKDRDYKQFREALKGNRVAQQKLADMRKAFKDLINARTVKTKVGQAEAHVDMPRSTLEAASTLMKKLTAGKYDKAAVDIITNPNWDKQFFANLRRGEEMTPKNADRLLKLLEKVSISVATETKGD